MSANPLSTLVDVYIFVIFVYVFIPWISPSARYQNWYRSLGQFVEPYLSVFRRFIPPMGGMLDLSPMVAIFVLIILSMILRQAGL